LRVRSSVSNDVSSPERLGVLRREIREALEAGVLPLAQLGSVVRRGTGQPCFICKEVIETGQLERDVRLGPREAVMVHEPCYLLWRVETMARAAKLLRR
jgi:hypothetical protein